MSTVIILNENSPNEDASNAHFVPNKSKLTRQTTHIKEGVVQNAASMIKLNIGDHFKERLEDNKNILMNPRKIAIKGMFYNNGKSLQVDFTFPPFCLTCKNMCLF